MLERFYPKTAVDGAIYNDGYMQQYVSYISPINPNVCAYSTFIGGDNPLTVFTTNAPTDRKLCIIKESYGDAFATWALNNYSEVYVIDPRYNNDLFNSNGGELKLDKFYDMTHFDDLVILNYPASVESEGYRYGLYELIS